MHNFRGIFTSNDLKTYATQELFQLLNHRLPSLFQIGGITFDSSKENVEESLKNWLQETRNDKYIYNTNASREAG